MPDYELERKYGGLVAGVDEVGRGPLAGPVVAAAVAFRQAPSSELSLLLDDSKKLTTRKREKAYQALCQSQEAYWALGAASVDEIDQINIGQACFLAMKRAVDRLALIMGRAPDLALVDGNRAPQLLCPVTTVIGGDGVSLSIAAASVLAKVVRDRMMARLAIRYPGYGWERNAGYGTVAHMTGLKTEGVTLHHRRAFAPIRRLIEAEVRVA
ncbi:MULTISPECIES: ribonuclease HII [Saccharibacter]|uniref:Ribonuclease HII n=1 Tax=Saccharibacter floricola DSM 15669 TaxID=1123227 RepID=A0ABQ0NX82_9PROT|nr:MULTISPECIES: ribonuclease HII [Saccharibacter]MXV35043.1 ribonuclease HII [Saccharibacter sp. EH611]MXV57410.1 ribonuclease HII [Saccharibacter sp. EH70]MXV64729.1 ribonuclease HII [Saccharibacter sp. EH60]GBQ05652.1 ribonuclease HII [Saccharibacter floricola DSM 15669]